MKLGYRRKDHKGQAVYLAQILHLFIPQRAFPVMVKSSQRFASSSSIHLHLDILPAAPAGQAAKAGRVFRPVSAHHEGCRGPAAVAYRRTAVILHSIATPRFSLSIPRLLFNSTPFYDRRLSFYLAGQVAMQKGLLHHWSIHAPDAPLNVNQMLT